MLLRGGRRDAEVVLVAEFEAVGDGVDDILMSGSSGDMAAISTFTSTAMFSCDALSIYQCTASHYSRELSFCVARRDAAVTDCGRSAGGSIDKKNECLGKECGGSRVRQASRPGRASKNRRSGDKRAR